MAASLSRAIVGTGVPYFVLVDLLLFSLQAELLINDQGMALVSETNEGL